MNKQGNAYISPNTTISANRQFTILRWSLLYSRGFLRETPEGPPIVLRSRYTYIIILFDYNIIYIIQQSSSAGWVEVCIEEESDTVRRNIVLASTLNILGESGSGDKL